MFMFVIININQFIIQPIDTTKRLLGFFNKISQESDEEIVSFNKENSELFKHRFGENVVTIPNPKGFVRLTTDSIKTRTFKEANIRDGFRNLQFYIPKEDCQKFEDDNEFLPETFLILSEPSAEIFKNVTNELFDDMEKQFKRDVESEFASLKEAFIDARVQYPELQSTEVESLGTVRVNKNFFHHATQVKDYSVFGLEYVNLAVGHLKFKNSLLVLYAQSPTFKGASEKRITQWAEEITNANIR